MEEIFRKHRRGRWHKLTGRGREDYEEMAARITAEQSDVIFPLAFAEPTVISVFTMCLCKVLRSSEDAGALAFAKLWWWW